MGSIPNPSLAPGTRVLIRDAEWLVRKVDRTANGRQAVSVVGLSQIVKDREATFLEEIDRIELLNPVDTEFVADPSSFYRDSILFMESLLRQTPPTDEYLYIGHQGAMDVVPYQIDPAIQALQQPRQRILMADAVGLGKTIEVGLTVREALVRGWAERALLLVPAAVINQWQEELAEKLALWYDVDPMEVKTDLLLTLIDARRSEPAMSIPQLETIESGLELIRQAVAEDKYKAAQRMYKPILATARKTKDAMVVQEVTGVGKEIDRLESEFAKLADAKTTLARDPEDPDANLVMGRRYCFDRNLWVQGLVYLSKGSNKTLAELARRDLASPESPEEQTALGDAWWDQAEKEAGQTKIAMQLRAGHWYQQDFGGLSRETTRRRLAEIAPMTPLEQYWQQAVKQPGNVALAVNGAEVRGGGNGLIDGEIPPALTGRGIASGNWPCQWTVVFDKIYAIREIRLMLPEGRNSYENYTLEFSADGKNFFPLADRSGGRWSGPQQFRFLARPMQAIRLTGTFHSLNRQFHASELEAYYVPPRN